MPLVEVVVGRETDAGTAARAEAVVTRWGKTPIRCADSPGFVVNRINRPFTLEALRLLEGGTATIEEIDGAMRDDGFPQGPFEHIDLIGLDVNLATSTAVHAGLGSPDPARALGAAGPPRRRAPPRPQARRRLLRVRRDRPSGPAGAGLRAARRQARPAPGLGDRDPHPAGAGQRGVLGAGRRRGPGRPHRPRARARRGAPAGADRVGDRPGARSRARGAPGARGIGGRRSSRRRPPWWTPQPVAQRRRSYAIRPRGPSG